MTLPMPGTRPPRTTRRPDIEEARSRRSLRPTRAFLLASLLLAGALATHSASARAELVAHWSMDRFSVADTLQGDVAGTDGTLEGSLSLASYVPGVLGQALEFDGVDEFVVHPVAYPEAGTIGHWLNPDDAASRVALYWSDFPATATDYNGFGAGGEVLEAHTGSAEGTPFALHQDGFGIANTTGSGIWRITAGEFDGWTHVAMTWDPAGDLVLYVDCLEVGREPMSTGVLSGRISSDRFIGRPSEAVRFWKGEIDEIRIYDHPMTPAEVEATFCAERRIEDATLTSPSPMALDGFASSLGLDGDTLLVGVSGRDSGSEFSGTIQIWERSGPGMPWSFVVERGPSDPVAHGRFGIYAALSGDFAIVTAGGPDKVYLLERDFGGTDNWGEKLTLTADGDDFGVFGGDVDIDGSVAAIASQVIYVYERGGSTWTRIGKIPEPPGGSPFLDAIALSGDLVAIRAVSGIDLFRRDLGGPNAWGHEKHVPKPDGTTSFGAFGALDLLGDTLMVGAEGDDDSAGAVYVYKRNQGGSGSWGLVDRILANDRDPKDKFGRSIAMASEEVALVGTFPSIPDHGVTYVVARHGDDWRVIGQLLDAGGGPFDEFGTQLAFDGASAVVGAGASVSISGSALDYELSDLAGFPLFADGFESGDADAWSAASP